MSAIDLWLVRHGETPWNAAGRIQGHIDIPLSEHGHWQAERLAAALAGQPLAALVCSDLQRALQTAAPLARSAGVAVEPEPGLRERGYGEFEGLTRDQIQSRFPDAFAHWQTRDPDFAPAGGETMRAFAARVEAALWAAARRVAGAGRPGPLVAVAHGGVLDVAYRLATGMDWRLPRRHPLLNAGINRLVIRFEPPALQLVDWGDVGHLAESDDDVLA